MLRRRREIIGRYDKALGFDIKDYPNAYNQFVCEVTLPLHTRLTDEEVDYVITNFVDIIKNL